MWPQKANELPHMAVFERAVTINTGSPHIAGIISDGYTGVVYVNNKVRDEFSRIRCLRRPLRILCQTALHAFGISR
jgi:hypothetical protein